MTDAGRRRGLIGLVAAFAVIELLTRAELVDPGYLPPASTILITAAGLLLDPGFLAHVGGTLAAWALGLGLATALGVPLGLLLGSSRAAHTAAIAAVELFRPIPSVALIPLAILLLGRGLDMKVALVAYASVWPILLNTIAGVGEVDPIARDTARSFGYGPAAIAWRVALRSAAPFIATGVRISAGIALILAISAELIAGGGLGIGTWMLERSGAGVPRELLYAAIVVAGLIGVGVNAGLAVAERHLFAWHPRLRGAT